MQGCGIGRWFFGSLKNSSGDFSTSQKNRRWRSRLDKYLRYCQRSSNPFYNSDSVVGRFQLSSGNLWCAVYYLTFSTSTFLNLAGSVFNISICSLPTIPIFFHFTFSLTNQPTFTLGIAFLSSKMLAFLQRVPSVHPHCSRAGDFSLLYSQFSFWY